MPSRSIAVQRIRPTPAAVQRASAAAVGSCELSSQPAVRTTPSATSTATTSRSPSAATKSSSGIGAERGGCDHHARDAGGDKRLRVGDRADAAAELHRHGRSGRDRAACQLERRAAVPRGAERDDVDERWAGGRDPGDQLEGIAGVERDTVEVALFQAHGLPVEDVDGGDELEVSFHVLPC